jgi:hypothetical protein
MPCREGLLRGYRLVRTFLEEEISFIVDGEGMGTLERERET